MAMLAPASQTSLQKSARVLLIGVIAAGTGGTPQILPNHVGYTPNVRFVEQHRKSHVVAQIQQIIEELGVSNAGLARAMGVSRQAIYNWLKGDPLKDEHQSKIASLARACDVLRKLDVLPYALLKQPLESGQNFWALVRDGRDAETLATRLASVFQTRQQQRDLMAERGAAKRARGFLADIVPDDFS
jgi:transcriptional regulator with XRE-family HTH domain